MLWLQSGHTLECKQQHRDGEEHIEPKLDSSRDLTSNANRDLNTMLTSSRTVTAL